MKRCYRCGVEWVSEKKLPAVKEFCAKCSAYLHACLNCRHYDPHAHNKCRIPTTDWVADREGCNFCDEFEFRDTALDAGDGGKKVTAKTALDQLLGEDAALAKPDVDVFKKLFGD